VSPKLKLDFLRRQVLMSRNISGGPLISVFMSGLNYQIEHHLFPTLRWPGPETLAELRDRASARLRPANHAPVRQVQHRLGPPHASKS
jgi:fatty acid desaturase